MTGQWQLQRFMAALEAACNTVAVARQVNKHRPTHNLLLQAPKQCQACMGQTPSPHNLMHGLAWLVQPSLVLQLAASVSNWHVFRAATAVRDMISKPCITGQRAVYKSGMQQHVLEHLQTGMDSDCCGMVALPSGLDAERSCAMCHRVVPHEYRSACSRALPWRRRTRCGYASPTCGALRPGRRHQPGPAMVPCGSCLAPQLESMRAKSHRSCLAWQERDVQGKGGARGWGSVHVGCHRH